MPSNPSIESQVSVTQGAESADAKTAPTAPPPTDAIAEARGSLMPPQTPGAPQRLYSTGSPASFERLNVAIKVLRDPLARGSFMRAYSGQTRSWNR